MQEIQQVKDARNEARNVLLDAMALPSSHPLWDTYVAKLKVYAALADLTDKQAHTELCGGLNNA